MADKGILAYFHDPAEAEQCRFRLQALRASDIQIDRVGENPGTGSGRIMNPLSQSGFPGLGYLTLDSAPAGPDVGILLAANVDASGLSDGSPGLQASDKDGAADRPRDTLLTVVIDEAMYDQAQRVIADAGGVL